MKTRDPMPFLGWSKRGKSDWRCVVGAESIAETWRLLLVYARSEPGPDV
jgi:hypothetical protein